MKHGLAALMILVVAPCYSQTVATGKAEKKGSCSPAVTGSNNQFRITCQGIPKELGARLIELLNRIANNQTDAQAMMAKLDGCLAGASQVNQNSTGTNSPNVSAPNGIAIGGGTVSNPTVNNYVPPSRRLSDEQKALLVTCLKTTTGKFTVGAISNNGEAYRYAQDWSEVFSAAGWTNEQPIPVAIFMIGGGMWSGLHVSIHGTWNDVSRQASLVDGSAEKNALGCFNKANISGGGVAIPYNDMPTDIVRIDVSDRP